MITIGGLLLLAAASVEAQIAFRASASGSSAVGASPTFIATNSVVVNAGSVTINRPAGVVQSDILIAQITVKGIRTVTPPGVAGDWNLIDSTSSTSFTQAIFWRRVIVVASEPASYTFTFSGSDRAVGNVTAYRNVDPVGSPLDVFGVNAGSAASMTLPTITTTQTNTLLVALLGSSRAGNNHGIPTGMTTQEYQFASGAGPNGVTTSLDEQAMPTPGSSGAKTATMSSSSDYVAHLLALAGGSALSIPVPTGTVAGDVMVASIAVRPCTTGGGACTLTINTPAGWTLLSTISQTTGGSTGSRLAVYYRVATAADPGATYTWGFGGSPAHTGAVGGISSFSGVDTTSPIVANAGQATASSSSHATPSISTGTVTNTMLVGTFSVNASGTWTPPGGMTEAVDISSIPPTSNVGISLQMTYMAQAAAGSVGPFTATLSNPPAANTGATYLLALRPGIFLNHYAISVVSATVANCDYAQITITGHDATHNPVVPPAGRSLTLNTSIGSGAWQAGTVAGSGAWTPSGSNNGVATYVWPGGTEQSVTVRLRQTAVTSLNINLNDGFVTEGVGEDPTISFVNSAFRISDGAGNAASIGSQIAGKASNVGFGAQTLYLQAVRTDTNTGACTSLYASGTDVSITVGAQCNNPASCTQNLTLTSSAASSNTAIFVPSGAYATSMNFRFTTANAEAPFALNYADAGQITLLFRGALPSPPANQFITGTSNAFVVRPFGFAFRGANASTAASHGTNQTATVLAAAGDNFTMTLGAYLWANGQDVNNDGIPDAGVNLTGNGLTPNFAATTTVSATANLPGVALGSMSRASGAATITSAQWSGGSAVINDWQYSEVGNVFLAASASSYLGDATANVAGDSGMDGTGAAGGYIGRFRPKQFAVSGGTLANRSDLACAPASTFTYMNETFQLGFTLTAQNAQGSTTQNYTGAYAKLGVTTFSNWSLGARSGTTNLTSRIDSSLAPAGSWSNGVANVTITTDILRALPDNPDGPYAALQLGIAPVDSDTTGMASFNFDADNNGINERTNLGVTTEARFGRLRLDNALGPETSVLPIPITLEYWNGSGFATNALDSCTTLNSSDIALDFTPVTNLIACETRVQAANVAFSSGVGTLALTAPGSGNNGTVLLTANLGTAAGNYCNAASSYVPATNAAKSYLLGRWNDASDPDGNPNTLYDDKPTGRAAFGLYGSQPKNFIYFRENY
jgi:hypothetical protein